MEFNLSQMQAVQRAFESFDIEMDSHEEVKYKVKQHAYNLRPVFNYKGHLLMGDFYEIDDLKHQPCIVDFKEGNKQNLKHAYEEINSATDKAYSRFLNHPHFEIFNDQTLMFSYVESIVSKWKDLDALPTKFLKNIRCLDGSIDDSINFIKLDNDPTFDWISLVPKN